MFESLDSIASVVGIFMYLTISKFKQVPMSRKGLDYNTASYNTMISHEWPLWLWITLSQAPNYFGNEPQSASHRFVYSLKTCHSQIPKDMA